MTATLTPGTDRTEDNTSIQSFSPFEDKYTHESEEEHEETSEEKRLPSEWISEWDPFHDSFLLNEYHARTKNIKKQIRSIYDELWEEHDEFHELDKDFLIDEAHDFFSGKSEGYLEELTRNQLKSRLEKIGWLELGAGLLDDLNEEEKERYKEASKRRPLFS